MDEVTARLTARLLHIRNRSSPWLPLAKLCILRCSTTRCITALPTSSQQPVSDPDRFSYGIVPAPSVEHQTATRAQKFRSCPIQQHPTVSKRRSHFVGRQQHDVASGLRVHRAGRPQHGIAVLREVLFEALQRRLCGSAQPCKTLGQAGRIGRSSMKIAQGTYTIGSSALAARQTSPTRRAALTSYVETRLQTSLLKVGASAAAVGCSDHEQQQAPSPYQASLAAALHCLPKRETACSAPGANSASYRTRTAVTAVCVGSLAGRAQLIR